MKRCYNSEALYPARCKCCELLVVTVVCSPLRSYCNLEEGKSGKQAGTRGSGVQSLTCRLQYIWYGYIGTSNTSKVNVVADGTALRLTPPQLRYWNEEGQDGGQEGIQEGDVVVSNHPQLAGGSHLPDITVITPVFEKGDIVFFVASRGGWTAACAGRHQPVPPTACVPSTTFTC